MVPLDGGELLQLFRTTRGHIYQVGQRSPAAPPPSPPFPALLLPLPSLRLPSPHLHLYI